MLNSSQEWGNIRRDFSTWFCFVIIPNDFSTWYYFVIIPNYRYKETSVAMSSNSETECGVRFYLLYCWTASSGVGNWLDNSPLDNPPPLENCPVDNSYLGKLLPGQLPPDNSHLGQLPPGQFPPRIVLPCTIPTDKSLLGLLYFLRIFIPRQLLPRGMIITNYSFFMTIFCFFSMVQLNNLCCDNKNNNDNINETWSLK